VGSQPAPFSCCSCTTPEHLFTAEPRGKTQPTLWPGSRDAERRLCPGCNAGSSPGTGAWSQSSHTQGPVLPRGFSPLLPGAGTPRSRHQAEQAAVASSQCCRRSADPLLIQAPEQFLLLLPSTGIFLSLFQNLSSFQEISVCVRQGNGTCSYCWTLVQKLLLLWLCSSADSPPPRATARACSTHCRSGYLLPPPTHTGQSF